MKAAAGCSGTYETDLYGPRHTIHLQHARRLLRALSCATLQRAPPHSQHDEGNGPHCWMSCRQPPPLHIQTAAQATASGDCSHPTPITGAVCA